MKIGSIEIDENIVRALRDGKLVVFAGAGVSMGSPSNLPSFEQLAIAIAKGTGYEPKPPWDQLLGNLQSKGVSVHEIAAQHLFSPENSPNDLHRNLLLLFRSFDRVRLITTNFDYHFENAAKELFVDLPEIYRAPALPLGREFNGIAYVHGSLKQPKNMVLTDVDFGRAYLTEGWVRRFLVEIFQNYIVLFVGYSYDDIVMQYLVRALPASNEINRFVLISNPEKTETCQKWASLGITPIVFNLACGDNQYIELYNCINQLANRSIRGVLDWQNRIAEICKGVPPIDDELIGEIEQALNEVYTARFFAKVARDVHWPRWLNEHRYLDALFNDSKLNERDEILATWLVENYSTKYPEELFNLLETKGIHLNSAFWVLLVRKLGINDTEKIEERVLSRWITIILESAPLRTDYMMLGYLAERCFQKKIINQVLRIFLFISSHFLNVKSGFVISEEDQKHEQRFDIECKIPSSQWTLNKIWAECLKPNIALVAQPLLSGIVYHFESMFTDLMAWGQAERNWDMCSIKRSAIEPHSQDKHPESIDVLIDAARDTLEWISADSPILLESWSERLIISDVPILRRIGIHAITLHPKKTADEILLWLLNSISLNSIAEHHEIYRALALYYPKANSKTRRRLVDTILSYRLSATEDRSEEEWTARSHFDLLSWLMNAKPNCLFAKKALTPITKQYPNWKVSEHQDFTFWHGSMRWGSISPWTVEQLLAMEPQEKIGDFLSFKGDFFEGPDRNGLTSAIKEACKQDVNWAFALMKVLAEKKEWDSDIWSSIIQGLQEADLSETNFKRTLKAIAKPKLYIKHSYSIANFLYHIVKEEGKTYALNLLEDANKVALDIWEITEAEEYENISDWLQKAINETKGIIVEFWLHSLSLLMQNKSKTERSIPENYKKWFEQIVEDPTVRGGVGRSLLCSQTPFLYGLDGIWVQNNIIPLFSESNEDFFSQAWHGFLAWGNLSNSFLAEKMLPAFISAVKRLDTSLSDYRDRFIEFYAYLAVFTVEDPIENFIPELFKNGSLHVRARFASHLGYMLSQMDDETKKQLWDRWLKSYWEGRLHNIPAPLVSEEIVEMLDWLPALNDLFGDAVSYAIQMPAPKIEPSAFLYELRESDLKTNFQKECAELLIYLSKCIEGYLKGDLSIIAESLKEIPSELRNRLDEALALIGVMSDK